MTAKRFTLGVCEKGLGLTDNETKEQYLETDDTTLIRLCEVLNEVHEEAKDNEHYHSEVLRLYKAVSEENEQLKFQLQNTSDQRDEFHRGARENANRVGKLKKENEQLKQDRNALIHLLENQSMIIEELHSILLTYQLKEPIVLTKEDLNLMGKAIGYYTHGRYAE